MAGSTLAKNRPKIVAGFGTAHGFVRRVRAAFTLADVLVSISVISVLIGLMLPSLVSVRETARKVKCSINIRQIGIGVQSYADDKPNRGVIPFSTFSSKHLNDPDAHPQAMMQLRLENSGPWDGLGLLVSGNYLAVGGPMESASLFYCPSHTGSHRFDQYADAWLSGEGEIVGNYHFRGSTRDGITRIERLPTRFSVVTDGLATQSDFNHRTGSNVLTADQSVLWFDDGDSRLLSLLATSSASPNADIAVENAWAEMDQRVSRGPR